MASALQSTVNVLSVSGTTEDVDKFLKRTNEGIGLSFATFIPVPADIIAADHKEDNGSTLVENWCYKNWGTMREPENVSFEDSAQSPMNNWSAYTISFNTCMPPLPVIEEISRQFPNLKITMSWGYDIPMTAPEPYDKFYVADSAYSFTMMNGVKQATVGSQIDIE